ncbi:MAG TPA: rRNA maturation RNase YbeY [Chitinophagaceae bacterium]|jgi:rRNA maturation RNase YbeY|nr:rRNA maturation RNase YbeY [Chitinophagaceae bacterium]
MPVSPSKSKICFFFQDTSPALKNRSELKKFIGSIFKKEGKELESLNYIFCTDKALLEINRQYMGHDYYTDIITFELSKKGGPVQGEIYISIDRVRENAQTHQQSFKSEIHRVIFHGTLHLCGYADKTPKDSKKMRSKEDSYLLSYFE